MTLTGTPPLSRIRCPSRVTSLTDPGPRQGMNCRHKEITLRKRGPKRWLAGLNPRTTTTPWKESIMTAGK